MLAALASEAVEPEFWTAVGDTVQGWGLGLAIAAGLGIPLGIVVGSSRLLYRASHALVEFLRPVPSVALIPLAVLAYGSGMVTKVLLAAFAAFWHVFIQTLYGVQDVDPVASDTARSFGFSRVQRLVLVTLPSAMPYVMTGLRIGSAVSLILAVTAEIVIGAHGLGRSINEARAVGDVDRMYGLIFATGLLGLTLNALFTFAGRRLLHWHPSQRAGRAAMAA
jgi:ABC-type nitrate/sulfonate/bicarbonate transport system permease component